jgi:hypothetical protein
MLTINGDGFADVIIAPRNLSYEVGARLSRFWERTTIELTLPQSLPAPCDSSVTLCSAQMPSIASSQPPKTRKRPISPKSVLARSSSNTDTANRSPLPPRPRRCCESHRRQRHPPGRVAETVMMHCGILSAGGTERWGRLSGLAHQGQVFQSVSRSRTRKACGWPRKRSGRAGATVFSTSPSFP